MIIDLYILMFILTVGLFLAGFFGVPKQDRNTRTTLMAIVCVFSFAMAITSFSVDITDCAMATNTTCVKYVWNETGSAGLGGLWNTSSMDMCTNAGMQCTTLTYNEPVLIGLFFLIAALSLIYVLMEMLGYLPTEQTGRSGLYGAERQAPQEFGRA
jgi:hypothetical protein